MKLYHGTSYENAERILTDGFNSEDTIWNCSLSDVTYFWSPDRLLACGESDEYSEDSAINRAFESAQIASSFYGSLNQKMIVIEYELEDPENAEIDDSCENMEHCVYIIDASSKGKITNVFEAPYNPDLRAFYLLGLMSNDYFNKDNLSSNLLTAIEILSTVDCVSLSCLLMDDCANFKECIDFTLKV